MTVLYVYLDYLRLPALAAMKLRTTCLRGRRLMRYCPDKARAGHMTERAGDILTSCTARKGIVYKWLKCGGSSRRRHPDATIPCATAVH